jgi:excisionase family DNA binding protein
MMQENPITMREDVTVSLNKDLIDTLLGIAEVRGMTLSVLVRDILGVFCQAFESGTDWTRYEKPVSDQTDSILPRATEKPDENQINDIISRLQAHGAMISALQNRVLLLESQSAASSPELSVIPPVEHNQPGPVFTPGYGTNENRIPVVIDSDALSQNRVSDEALVKSRPPVSPIITSVDVSGIGRIIPEKPYTQTEAAVLLRISLAKFRKYVKDGRIPSQKVGRTIICQGKDLIAFQTSTA